jgi:iron complex outermembrane receptor protein
MTRIPFALRAGTALFAMTVATAAAAQSNLPPEDVQQNQATTSDETTRGGDIVVTGSRIRRDPLSQDSPITFVDQADIAKTGLNSINDVLQRLPSAAGGINGKFNNSGNLGNPPSGAGVGAGAAEIDLRYLGSTRTLVLVDGLRFVLGASASGVPGSTDLNAIPDSMIERIEVLQDGASAIYGSDAIAGVVNIITKKRQEGLLASAQVGQYGQGDGTTQNYQISWGNGGDGPFEVVVGGNYVKGDGVKSADRAISRFPQPYSTSCLEGGCSGTPLFGQYRFFGALTPTVNDPATPGNEDVVVLSLRHLVPGRAFYNPANPTDPLSDFRGYASDGSDNFNFAPYNYLQIPLERLGAFANAKYEVSDAINFSTKLVWNHRKSKNQAAPLPLLIGQGAGNLNLLDTIDIDATNPFNPVPGTTLDESNYILIRKRMVELGPRRFNQSVKTFYGVGTLDGKFTAANSDWFWDVNVAYGKNKAKQTMLGNLNAAKLQQGLGPAAACTAPCVPVNLFGGPGTLTQAMIDFIGFTQRDSSEQSQWDFTGNISGNLFELPGGPLGVAAGVEYRDLKGRFDPDPVIQAGLGADIPAQATKGSYNVKEAYAEVNAPILSGQPGADLLELNGAVRFSDYSTSGSSTTFKGGVNWKPIADLRLRGSYSEGFRAPSIGELFGTFSRFDSAFDDPCSVNSARPRNITNDATVLANCTAQGGVGASTRPDDQLSVITGGNEDLKPETSTSWNFGGVYSPSFIPRLSLEVNWYKIKVDDAIQAFPAQTSVENCVYDNDPTACARITRAGAGGDIVGITSQLENVAGIRTKGIDANLTYRTTPTSAGTFGFTWNNTFLRNFDLILPTGTGTQTVSREGTEVGSPSQAYPKWKSIGIVDWDMNNFGASITGRYIKNVTESSGKPGTAAEGLPHDLGNKFYTDVQLRMWAPGLVDKLGFAFGVNNLFNTKTPACFTCDVNGFDPTTYEIPGRYFYFRMTARPF